MPDNQQKQLFTELTPEEGAIVAGGATLELLRLTPSNPLDKNDPDPFLDPIVMVGTKKVYSESDMKSSKWLNKKFQFTGGTTLSLWDQDDGSNEDDLLVSVNLKTPTGERTITGGGMSLTYRVLA